MKRFLSVILVVTIVASCMCLNPAIAQSIPEQGVYTESYGRQLSKEEDYLSRYIYDQMVQTYVLKEGDLHNQNGKYTGLAKPLAENGKIDLGATVTATKIFKDITAIKEYDWSKSTEYLAIDRAVRDAMDSFVKDYPQVYWLSKMIWDAKIAVEQTEKENGIEAEITFYVTLRPEEYEEGIAKDINHFNNAVCQAKDTITSSYNITSGTPTESIVKYIHDYIALRVDYNYEAVNNPDNDKYNYAHTSYSVFLSEKNGDNKVVCEGYSEAFKILCDQFDIPCALLSGSSINPQGGIETHVWNAVEIMGKWYAVDIAWDDQADMLYSTYLLAGKQTKGFFDIYERDHIADGRFSEHDSSRRFILPQIAEKGFWQDSESTDSTTETPPAEQTTDTNVTDHETEKVTDNATNPTKKPGESNNNSGSNIIYNKVSYHWVVSGLVKSKTYTGKQIKQKVKITCDGNTLKEGRDYKITYKNNVNVGTAKITFTPMGKYKNVKSLKNYYEYKITKASITKVTASKIKAQKYKKGKAIKPAVKLKFNGKKLKKGKNYTISYKKNKKRGTAQIIIKGKGNFKGTKKIKFKIK